MKTFKEFITEASLNTSILDNDEIILELFGQEQRLKNKIKNTKDSATKKALRDKLTRVQKRNKTIKTAAKVIKSFGPKKRKSSKMGKIGGAVARIALGSIIPF